MLKYSSGSLLDV